MSKNRITSDNEALKNSIVSGIQEIKGHDIVVLDLREIDHAVCEYFIVCHGTSNTQVNGISDSVIKQTKKDVNEKPWSKEGFANSEWVILDYGTVVVHIFQKEIRDYFNIEGLWADAKVEVVENQD